MNNPYYEYKITAETIVKTASSLWLGREMNISGREFFIAVCKCALHSDFIRNVNGYLTAAAFLTCAEPKNSPQYSALERLARYSNIASLDLLSKELRQTIGASSLSSCQTSMLDELLSALGSQE